MEEGDGVHAAGGADPVADDQAALLRAWMRRATAALEAHRGGLDRLNVFPVADADTGTNLYLTLCDASHRAGGLPAGAPAAAVARAIAHGALIGARGNSGIILSQYLGALVSRLVAAHAASDGARLAEALRAAAEAARGAVARPVEGTVLTVVDEVGRSAVAAAAGSQPQRLAEVLRAGLDGGYAALDRTREQLAALRAARVRDAGAWGLLLVLDALLAELGAAVARPVPGGEGRHGADGGSGVAVGGAEFEVMSLVEACAAGADGADPSRPGPTAGERGAGTPGGDAPTVDGAGVGARLRAGLERLGESVAVVETDGLWHLHVHTDDPLAAVRLAPALGLYQRQVGVRHLSSQAGVHGPHQPSLGLVVVTTAPGLSAELARAGAVVVVAEPGDDVDPAAVERAVEDTGAEQVLLLVSDRVAGARGARLRVRADLPPVGTQVLDGVTEAQLVAGAATLAGRAGEPSADRLAQQVTDAVLAVRTAQVDPVGAPGHASLVTTTSSLLADGADLLMVVTSVATPVTATTALEAHVRTTFPRVDVVVLAGASPGSALVLGAERTGG